MMSWRTLHGCLLLLALPSFARAQTCRGVPVEPHNIAIEGGVIFAEGSKAYAGQLYANAAPIVVSGGYALELADDVDVHANNFNGSLAFELPDLPFSACPFVGVAYSRVAEDFDGVLPRNFVVSTLTIPVGFALGGEIPAGSALAFVPYVVPQFFYLRATAGYDDDSVSGSTEEFGANIGVSISGSIMFVGGSVGLTTIDGSEPTFAVSIGLMTR